MNVGDTFQVMVVADHRDGEMIISRYVPGTGYRVTPRNLEFVRELEAKGDAKPFDARRRTKAQVRGRARTG